MSEQLPAQPVVKTDPDLAMRRLREYVSAGMAGIIILGTVIMMIMAFSHLQTPDEFARVKDLLLFINPLLGVVIGYYFNKVTSEARAETAEKTVQSAMTSAQQASAERDKAQADAKSAKSEAQETKEVLKDMVDATEKTVAQAPAEGTTTLAVDEQGRPAPAPSVELQLAWTRAKRLLEH
jgi:predicted lipid-binding transport protein (Tim44 family)